MLQFLFCKNITSMKTCIFFQISKVLFQNLKVSDASIVSVSKIYMIAILFVQTTNDSAKLGCLLWQNIPIFACLESLAVHYTHTDIMISTVPYLSFRWLKAWKYCRQKLLRNLVLTRPNLLIPQQVLFINIKRALQPKLWSRWNKLKVTLPANFYFE
jgi:hypothetical protein